MVGRIIDWARLENSHGAGTGLPPLTGTPGQPLAPILKPDLNRCQAAACLPEVLLICPNPDQLLPLLTPCVSLLERASETGTLDPAALPLPLLVLCSNGIYFQRIRQVFLEKLEESTLLGRLPDLWPDLMPSIVGRLLRGVSLHGLGEAVSGQTNDPPLPCQSPGFRDTPIVLANMRALHTGLRGK